MAKRKKKNTFIDPLSDAASEGLFKTYASRKFIGEKLIGSFLNLELNKNESGFVLSENNTDVGTISQCYGLLTLLEYANFNVDLSSYEGLMDKINATLDDILCRLHADEEELCFDATPYVKEEGLITKYVETAAITLRVFVEIRKLLSKDYDNETNTINISSRFVEKNEDMLSTEHSLAEISFIENLIVKCMNFISDSALRVNGEEGIDYYLSGSEEPTPDIDGENLKYKGWSFAYVPTEKHSKTGISLYYTYLVSEAYLTFYEAFKEAISLVRQLRANIASVQNENVSEEEGITTKQLIDMVVNANPEEYNITIKQNNKELLRNFEFLKRSFASYRKFNKTMLDAGHYVDMQFSGIDIAKDFFNYNFKIVTMDDIENSSSNDAMFNVLFAINILMASGVDIDYVENDMRDEFYDRVQYTVPNIQRFNKKLIRLGKSEAFDQYELKIPSAIPTDDQEAEKSLFKQVRAIRKQRVIALQLTPLIIKTYSTISKYIILYPQYEMRTYKDEILKKKMPNEWLWDSEGYQLINNFNYVFVLRAFYDYYETYEQPYAMSQKQYMDEAEKKIVMIEEEKKKLKDDYTEKIDNVKRELIALEEQHARELEEQSEMLMAQKSKLEEAVESVVNDMVSKALDQKLKAMLTGIICESGTKLPQSEEYGMLFRR